ncbi:hypothetical protein ALI22I_18035 [Saccharothrix sp. ALI-22-I]|uniref:hypothetical protein n=1 Tax=Saccharothrix sp. ALI-22-I TaxID=1933778 RepID=UPI00097C2924|nr:hypothetical protein [Saccharothrix sp. ALI-22-I]ONI88862.1 hypothetical protein ALI22I_18035 [Saccharothrix sp. ALI-22-I]
MGEVHRQRPPHQVAPPEDFALRFAPLIDRQVDMKIPPGLQDLCSSHCHGLLAKRPLPGFGLSPSIHRCSSSRDDPRQGPQ